MNLFLHDVEVLVAIPVKFHHLLEGRVDLSQGVCVDIDRTLLEALGA